MIFFVLLNWSNKGVGGGKMIKNILVLLFVAVFAFGCATAGGQNEFYTAQKDFLIAQTAQQKPLFEMKALEGTAIQNLKEVVVYNPTQPKDFKQYVAPVHPGWEVANTTIRTAGTVAGIYFAVDGVKSIFSSFSKIASVPTSSVTQNISGTGNTTNLRSMGDMSTGTIGSNNVVGGLLDQTSAPTVVNPLVVNPAVVDPVIVEVPTP